MAEERGDLDISWLEGLRVWCADGKEDRYSLFMVLMTPDGRYIAAFPGWSGEVDEQEIKEDLYGWLDKVVEGIKSPPSVDFEVMSS